MVDLLRRGFIYSEKRARDILFLEIEAILAESPASVSRLTREAAARARNIAQQAEYILSSWDTTGKATVNAMLGAGVLLGVDGQPIPMNIAAPAAQAVGLAEGFRDTTEAFLLEFLIRKLGDVTARDHTALAHALFRQFDRSVAIEDLEDRLVILLASLSDRVTMGEGGMYRVLAGPS
jgi:hypothetical protein